MKEKTERLIEKIDQKKAINFSGPEKTANVLKGIPVNRLPLLFARKNTSVPGVVYNLKDQFYDKEKMLYEQLLEIDRCATAAFDASLCIRPNIGVILAPAVTGLKYEVFEDKYPWTVSHLSKNEIMKLCSPEPEKSELFQRTMEYIGYFRETIPDWIHIYLPDTQGPFDIAHLIYGNDIFYDVYDDSTFVHDLMSYSTELYISMSRKLKEAVGEPLDACFHGQSRGRGIYMANGGVRISEDTPTLLSPDQIDEFVIPYVEKAFAPFNGGFVHFCGKNEVLLEKFLQLEPVRAVNLGQPEMYDFEQTMQMFIKYNKCFFAHWPKLQDETLGQYLQRMKNATSNGTKNMLLHFQEDYYPDSSAEKVLEQWESE